MKENIALIKEVHHKLPRVEAEAEARELLGLVGIEKVADFRSNMCTNEELFYVMVIRALMCDREIVLIKSPMQLLENLGHICKIIENIEKLNSNKGIIILDTKANYWHYKGCRCSIQK